MSSNMSFLLEQQGAAEKALVKKWAPVIDMVGENMPTITDKYKKASLAVMLENTVREENAERALRQRMSLMEVAPTNHTGSDIDNYDPVLITMIRRSMPNLIAYDICGVQPMTGPTGLVFALRPRYGAQNGTNAFYTEANTGFSSVRAGNTEVVGDANLNLGTTPTGNAQTYNFSGGMATLQAEALGSTSNVDFANMSLSIEKVTVTATSRAIKAEFSIEASQDLKAIHGLDMESELTNIITTETLADINREIVRTIYVTAKQGANSATATAGTFDLDVDSNGRWLAEKQKGLMMRLELDANQITKDTRRGKGNVIVVSSDVASSLNMTGLLDYAPILGQTNQMVVNDAGNTFVGVLNRQFKVFIDPYATSDYAVVGYKGTQSQWDAGLFYCPYVPIQLMRAQDPGSFQPKIAVKTRYGIVANPFAEGTTEGLGRLMPNSNAFYRRITVNNIM